MMITSGLASSIISLSPAPQCHKREEPSHTRLYPVSSDSPSTSTTGEASDQSLDENTIDLGLMAKVATGDHLAFAELVGRHQRAVVGTIAKMNGDPTLAEDLAQQVFLRVWKSAKRYKPSAKFTTWLYTIVRNLVFNEARRAWRRNEMSFVGDDGSDPDFRDNTQQSPVDETLVNELETEVDKALADLPDNQRLAVVLRWRENLSYEEIAEVLETSVSATKSLLFRARTQLKSTLGAYLES